jgi:porphobilinogen synthase
MALSQPSNRLSPAMPEVQQETKSAGYPRTRLRRNRQYPWVRRLVAENMLTTDDLIWAMFPLEGSSSPVPITSMPGVERVPLDHLLRQCEAAMAKKIPAVALFPVIDEAKKDTKGTEAIRANNYVCQSIRAIKKNFPDLGVFCDVALDPFTSHGHDGILEDGVILNDETIAMLCEQSLVQAEAGCDVIAPSDMMDGRVGAIRDALDAAGFQRVSILAYAAKYASGFYGPYRDALHTKGILKGDKKTYQMDPANSDEAIREVALDIAEGADMVMVKPGMPYLDIIRRVKDTFGMPTLAYHVSGEYAMLKAAAANGWVDHDRVLMETMMCFKRAGTDAVMTYAALEVAEILKKQA